MTTYGVVSFGTYEQTLISFAVARNEEDDEEERFMMAPLSSYAAHMGAVTSLAAHGGVLASGSSDETIKTYDLCRRVEIGRLDQHQGTVSTLSFASGGSVLLSGDAGQTKTSGDICVWRTKDWECLKTLSGAHPGGVLCVAAHPGENAKAALSVGADKTLRLWDLTTGKTAHRDRLGSRFESVTWEEDSGFLYVLAVDGGKRCKVVDARKSGAEAVRELEHDAQVVSVCPAGAQRMLVGCSNGDVTLWNVSTGEKIVTKVKAHPARARSLCRVGVIPGRHGDTDLVASASTDGLVMVWDAENLEVLCRYETKARINCAAATVLVGELPFRKSVKEEPHVKEEPTEDTGDAEQEDAEEVLAIPDSEESKRQQEPEEEDEDSEEDEEEVKPPPRKRKQQQQKATKNASAPKKK